MANIIGSFSEAVLSICCMALIHPGSEDHNRAVRSDRVQGALHAAGAAVEHVGVDQGGAHVFVPE